MPSMDDVTQFIGNAIGVVFGSRSGKILKRFAPRVTQINAMEPEIVKLTDRQLREKTEAFRAEIAELRAKDPRADESGRIDRCCLGDRRSPADARLHPEAASGGEARQRKARARAEG